MNELGYNQAEFRLHVAVIKHIESCFSIWYTSFPGRPGDAKDGWFRQCMGVKAGVPDILVLLKGGVLGAIELKVRGGKVSEAQRREPCYMEAAGAKIAVCRTVREVHNQLVAWGCKAAYESVVEPDLRSDVQKKQNAFDMYKPIMS